MTALMPMANRKFANLAAIRHAAARKLQK